MNCPKCQSNRISVFFNGRLQCRDCDHRWTQENEDEQGEPMGVPVKMMLNGVEISGSLNAILCPKCSSDDVTQTVEGNRCESCGHEWMKRSYIDASFSAFGRVMARSSLNPVMGVRDTFDPGEMAEQLHWGHLYAMVAAAPPDISDLRWYLHPAVIRFMQKRWYTNPSVKVSADDEGSLSGIPVSKTLENDCLLVTLHGLYGSGKSWAVSLKAGLEMYIWGVGVDGGE